MNWPDDFAKASHRRNRASPCPAPIAGRLPAKSAGQYLPSWLHDTAVNRPVLAHTTSPPSLSSSNQAISCPYGFAAQQSSGHSLPYRHRSQHQNTSHQLQSTATSHQHRIYARPSRTANTHGNPSPLGRISRNRDTSSIHCNTADVDNSTCFHAPSIDRDNGGIPTIRASKP